MVFFQASCFLCFLWANSPCSPFPPVQGLFPHSVDPIRLTDSPSVFLWGCCIPFREGILLDPFTQGRPARSGPTAGLIEDCPFGALRRNAECGMLNEEMGRQCFSSHAWGLVRSGQDQVDTVRAMDSGVIELRDIEHSGLRQRRGGRTAGP